MFCAQCGAPNSQQAKFCTKCGRETGTESASTDIATEGRSGTVAAGLDKRRWYFSGPVLLLAFLFLTPVWAILVLADRRRSRELKAFAALVAVGYVVLVAMAVAAYEKSGAPSYNEGVQNMEAGQMGLAEQQFKLALQRNPNLAEAHLNLGKIYLQTGWLDGAGAETGKAVEIFERTHHTVVVGATWEQSLSIAYNNLGAIESARAAQVSDADQQRVHRETAIADFRKAVELDPSDAQAQANLQRFGTAP